MTAAAATTNGSAPPKARSKEGKSFDRESSFGMSMWFEVRVQGLGGEGNLGKWSACNGLAVRLKTEPIPTGIDYHRPRIAPLAVEYPEITLERALRRGDHSTIHTWLQRYVEGWIRSDDAGAPAKGSGGGSAATGSTIVISLFGALRKRDSAEDHLVAEWTLHDAYPVAWTGPTLSTKSNDIATEKLTFAHAGFLHDANGPAENPENCMITLVEDKDASKKLELQYQPTELSIQKAVPSAARGNATVTQGDITTDPTKMNISFTVRVEGKDAVEKARAQLFDWVTPMKVDENGKEITGPVGKTDKFAEVQRPLKLTIGKSGFETQTVSIRDVTASVKRFSSDGAPSRATFTLKCEVGDQTENVAASGSIAPAKRTSAPRGTPS